MFLKRPAWEAIASQARKEFTVFIAHITIVFNFSWDDCNTHQKYETMVKHFFSLRTLGGGGGGEGDKQGVV